MLDKIKFFTLSLCLILCAICSDIVAKAYSSQSAYIAARSVHMDAADKLHSQAINDELSREGKKYRHIGMALAALSLLFWLFCVSRREPVWRLIPFGLFSFYILLQLALL